MPLNNDIDRLFTQIISRLVIVIVLLMAVVTYLAIAVMSGNTPPASTTTKQEAAAKPAVTQPTGGYWIAPDISLLESSPDKEIILYGRDLIAHTSDYFGTGGKVYKGTTNGMNCQNCHLEAGTKVFGNNYGAVASTYPKYRARSGSIENIYKRVNDCFERSLNGKPLETASKEMRAITAYIQWLGRNVEKGTKPSGAGLKDIEFMDRAASAANGKILYMQKCKSCHYEGGQGLENGDGTAFIYPPLWGEKSYTEGAGLYRLSNLAKFIKCNMPNGTSHINPQLTDNEAWDIAAFVNSQQRPHMDLSKDWPHVEEKPFDHPFGPYADGFDEAQHKLGPFKPVVAKLAALKKAKT